MKPLRHPNGQTTYIHFREGDLPSLDGWPAPEWLNSQDGGAERTWKALRARTSWVRIIPRLSGNGTVTQVRVR